MYPGSFGVASEDINCRCVSLTRARWALDEDELRTLKDRVEYYGLDKIKDFEDFKEKYIYISKNAGYNGIGSNSSRGGIIKSDSSRVHNSGATSGAYNNSNDPEGTKRDEHAKRFYNELRNSQKDIIVSAIATNAEIDLEQVSKMYDHLLINEYDLEKGKSRFEPDYYIAESLQRLSDGKNIQPHDLILIKHESMEYDLMNNVNMSYEEAHAIANKSYNYQEALDEWLDKNGK